MDILISKTTREERERIMNSIVRFIPKLITSMILSVVLFIGAFTVSNATESVDAVSIYIDRFGKETGCKAISVVVVENGEARFYGDPDGLYQIGSMTKAFTGLAVQKLIFLFKCH